MLGSSPSTIPDIRSNKLQQDLENPQRLFRPAFASLKGGVAMELRFAEGACATKDIDIGLTGERAERLRAFGSALALRFDEFTFQLKGKPLQMDNADAVR